MTADVRNELADLERRLELVRRAGLVLTDGSRDVVRAMRLMGDKLEQLASDVAELRSQFDSTREVNNLWDGR